MGWLDMGWLDMGGLCRDCCSCLMSASSVLRVCCISVIVVVSSVTV